MIKFEFFETENSHQCHFSSIGTFVVSIAHYMRAYFNYQALANGQDFELPSDAGYLNVSPFFEFLWKVIYFVYIYRLKNQFAVRGSPRDCLQ